MIYTAGKFCQMAEKEQKKYIIMQWDFIYLELFPILSNQHKNDRF